MLVLHICGWVYDLFCSFIWCSRWWRRPCSQNCDSGRASIPTSPRKSNFRCRQLRLRLVLLQMPKKLLQPKNPRQSESKPSFRVFTPVGGKHEPITGGNNWIKYFPPAISRGKIFWYARCDSNARPSESESDTLSNWATGTYSAYLLYRVFAAFARGNKKNKKIFKICEKSCWHFANKVIR